MTADLGTGGGNNITAMTLWSWSRIYGAPMTALVTPEAVPVIDQLAQLCIERWFDMLSRRPPTLALKKSFLKTDNLAEVEPWRHLLALNSPGPLPPDIPVFIAQGSADRLVLPEVTQGYAAALGKQVSRVRYLTLKGVGHAFIARDSAAQAIAWIAARFANRMAASDCGHLD
jgi:acetyl esterase/lipase